jgi:hypothetical protein
MILRLEGGNVRRFSYSWAFLALLVIAFLTIGARGQDPKKISEAAKRKITDHLKFADKRDILVFDHEGELLRSEKIRQDAVYKNESLADYVRKSAELNNKKSDDPVYSCQEPKVIPPPPQCVLCKSGRVFCSNAKFASSFGPAGAIK